MSLGVVIVTLLGCESPRNVKRPLVSPPAFPHGDQVTVVDGAGDAVGIVIDIKEAREKPNEPQVSWFYTVMFEGNRQMGFAQENLSLYRRMDWDEIDLSEESILDKGAAEIESDDAIP